MYVHTLIAPNLKKKIRVSILNEQGLEEAGIDGGGLFRCD